ncbi:hypothetical protein [Xanthobacter sp. ZOL 2024]
MKKASLFVAVTTAALCALPQLGLAAPAKFTCGWLPEGHMPAGEMKALLAAGDPLDKPEVLNAAVQKLQAGGMSRALIIDNLVSTYCPEVAANATLSDAQKLQRMRTFAGRVVRTVYSLETEDAVILDIPLAPTVVDGVNKKAQAAGVTPQEWAAGAVSAAVTAP